jgi:hypothetical protein
MVLNGILRIALLLLLATLAGCGSNQVTGQPPFVSISSLASVDGKLQATVNVRNINDVPLEIDSAVIEIESGEATLVAHSGPLRFTVDPNATEDLVIGQAPTERALDLLESLESGTTASLPFSLEGHVHTAADGNLPFLHQGYLFRVPGRPGQFRATSTRAPEQR